MNFHIGDKVRLKRGIKRYDLELDAGIIGTIFGFHRPVKFGFHHSAKSINGETNVQVDFAGVRATLRFSQIEKVD